MAGEASNRDGASVTGPSEIASQHATTVSARSDALPAKARRRAHPRCAGDRRKGSKRRVPPAFCLLRDLVEPVGGQEFVMLAKYQNREH
jgi:hypothetical protein